MFWSGLPLSLTWLAIGLSVNPAELDGFSFCQGFFTAIPWTSAGIKILRFNNIGKDIASFYTGAYISETIGKEMRKILSCCTSLQTTMGFVVSYSLGYSIGWRHTCFVMVAVNTLSSLLVLSLPETPYWLIENGKNKEAQ